MAKWLERITTERNIDGSSRTLGPTVEWSLTVHPAANGYLVATLGKLKAARKGTGHPTSLCRRLRIIALSNRHPPPNIRILLVAYEKIRPFPNYRSTGYVYTSKSGSDLNWIGSNRSGLVQIGFAVTRRFWIRTIFCSIKYTWVFCLWLQKFYLPFSACASFGTDLTVYTIQK